MFLKLIFFPVYIACTSVKLATERMQVVELTKDVHDGLVNAKQVLEELHGSADGDVRTLIEGGITCIDIVMDAQPRHEIDSDELGGAELVERLDFLIQSLTKVGIPLHLVVTESGSSMIKSQIDPIMALFFNHYKKAESLLEKMFGMVAGGAVRSLKSKTSNRGTKTTTTSPLGTFAEISIEEALLFIEGGKPVAKKSTSKKSSTKSNRVSKLDTPIASQQIMTVFTTTTTSEPTTTESRTSTTTTRRTTTRTTTRTMRTSTRSTTIRKSTRVTTRAATTTTSTEKSAPIRKILKRGDSLEETLAFIRNSSNRRNPGPLHTATTSTPSTTTTQPATAMTELNEIAVSEQIEMSGSSVVNQVTVIRQPVAQVVTQMWEVSEAILGLSEKLAPSLAQADGVILPDTPLRLSFEQCQPFIHNANMAIINMVLSVRGLRDFVNMLPVFAVQSYSVVPQLGQRYLRERREAIENVPIVVPSLPLTAVLTQIRELCGAMVRLADQLPPLRTQACAVAPDAAIVENICHCSVVMLQAQTAIDNMRMAVNSLIHTFNEYGALGVAQPANMSMNQDS